MIYVFDACALIAYLNDERGSEVIYDMLKKATNNEVEIHINIINLLEVHYANIRELGREQAVEILRKVLSAKIHVVAVISDNIFSEAARLKATYKIALADCIGLSTAIELSGKFVTSDHLELDQITNSEPDFIHWFR